MGSFIFGKEQTIEDKKYKVWITLIEGLGYRSYLNLINKFCTLERIWNATEEELKEIKGINKRLIQNILDTNIRINVDRHLNFMKKNCIDIIFMEDNDYPKSLKEIYDPPICLYIKGNKEILNNKSLAIIGCREYSEYGKCNAFKFANEISRYKINIVSGLARGIDSFAHLGAISANEKTVAVLGNGLDIIYPKENIKIANEIILKGGAIITEYPLGKRPNKFTFPARNRIISGMSDGILVIEAKEKSGTLITVDFALEQGRDIFVIPGNIDSVNSYGTNELIKQGAIVVTNIEDILSEIF